MGELYASPEMQEKVKCCIRRLHPCTVVIPSLIKRRIEIDHNQAKEALRKIAPHAGEPVDIEADSKLIRTYRGLGLRPGIILSEAADRWFYDPPGDEYLPLFPKIHELVGKWLPRVHSLLHPPP